MSWATPLKGSAICGSRRPGWSEIFANLAMHTFVATQMPTSLPTLEVTATVGAESRVLASRMRAEGYSTLEELEAHYTGGDKPMTPLNHVWFQYHWQRIAAQMFRVDGRHQPTLARAVCEWRSP